MHHLGALPSTTAHARHQLGIHHQRHAVLSMMKRMMQGEVDGIVLGRDVGSKGMRFLVTVKDRWEAEGGVW